MILENAYRYIRPELTTGVLWVPIDWERVLTHWREYIDGDTVSEKQALFALFALTATKALDEGHPVRVDWEQRLEEIWATNKPNLPTETGASVTYTPDKTKYDISTPFDRLSSYRQDEIRKKVKREKAAVYDYEDDQSTNTISYKQ